ncbi:hypothetical protein BP422_18355 [Brevibacillus formosus]|uniref:Uncharacterized protein n=1 Tax=Brevibacillus formosus TaxID=54913 RepID=A0A220MJT8_9BACL|nr:hypothetical protein BP422_18355 [Brevibacillus formosus]
MAVALLVDALMYKTLPFIHSTRGGKLFHNLIMNIYSIKHIFLEYQKIYNYNLNQKSFPIFGKTDTQFIREINGG